MTHTAPVPNAHKPFRVAVLIEDFTAPLDEGAKKAAFHITKALARQGNDIVIYTRFFPAILSDVGTLPRNKLLWNRSFARHISVFQPQVLLYIPSSSATLGAFIRAASLRLQTGGLPLAMLSMQYRSLPFVAHFLPLRKFAQVIMAQSTASAKIYQSYGCQTKIIHPGVDASVFRPVSPEEKIRLRQMYGFSAGEHLVLHVGHANPRRNIRIMAQLASEGVRPVLVTSTSTAADQALLSEMRQRCVIVKTGFLDHVEHFYQMADCYVFPTFDSSSAIDLPLSVLEAMACNLPVVTTPYGGLQEHFKTGDGLFFVASDEALVQQIGVAIHIPQCDTRPLVFPYSWDHAAETILNSLRELVYP